MDKGAHFYRCDFQVHSPRDINWAGPDAVSEDERRAYGALLVKACRRKKLHAIAVTDHHDLVFASYVRDAAREERDQNGDPVPEEQRIRVFPGMELTLAVPCQAILLFDADFPSDLFQLAINALAIQANDPTESKTAQTLPLPQLTTLSMVYEELDKHNYLRGRYILLPNVSEGGQHTLLRAGQAPKYRNMPCVGGYLDGSVERLGTGNLNIVEGKASQYGNKRIALFQTSDNRRADHADLGRHATWVKWAVPSAEALRQACLAQESRISQEEPVLPGTTIASIDVTNCSFFGPTHLEFSPQYTALIGGRGTGKSTILEYLRWALCDQPPPPVSDDELPDFQKRRRGLVDATLAKHDAVVEVKFLVNGIPHVVRRDSKTDEVRLKISDGPFEACKDRDVRSLLPVQAYSQKQLSNVGVRVEELQRFVMTPIQHELDEISQRFDSLDTAIRQEHAAVIRKRGVELSIANNELAAQSLSDQADVLRSSLVNLSEDDRDLIALSPRYEEANQAIVGWSSDMAAVEKLLAETQRRLDGVPSDSDTQIESLPKPELTRNARQAVVDAVDTAKKAVAEALSAVRDARAPAGTFGKEQARWSEEHAQFMERYREAKGRSSTHESKLQELEALEGRLGQTRANTTAAKSQLSGLGAPEEQYGKLRAEWRELHEKRSRLLETQCRSLTELSGLDIRATLRRGAGIEEVMAALKKAMAGTGLRREKMEALGVSLGEAGAPLEFWDKVLEELEILAAIEEPAGKPAPDTPLLASCDFSAKDIQRISAKFDAPSWLDLALTPMQDQPVFEFRAREDDYIPFENASAGQQATALLKTLLNQPGSPLLIDQPEDDLDNPVILEVVEQIWVAKKARQLVFSSHNANLVVNGDAELVVWCDHQTAGDHSKGALKGQGAIDVTEVRDAIKKVMEGGEQAFKLRRDKYGF